MRCVERAMLPGARLLIAEQGLLERGRERSANDFAWLMSRAGLELERTIPTPHPITLFVALKP